MSFRLQLSPQTSIRVAGKIAEWDSLVQKHLAQKHLVQDRWTARSSTSTGDVSLDMGFLRSWFEADREFATDMTSRVNWGAVYGMFFSVGFSAVCWVGVVWTATHIWR